jgi:hypothetical protein
MGTTREEQFLPTTNKGLRVAPSQQKLFPHKVLTMLLFRSIITQDLVNMLLSWHDSRYNVFCEPKIYPREKNTMESFVRYIIRAFLSHGRMNYFPDQFKGKCQ